jgi:threonine aldolase
LRHKGRQPEAEPLERRSRRGQIGGEPADKIEKDHARARRLAVALAAQCPGALDPEAVETNIVCADQGALPRNFVEQLDDRGVRVGLIDAQTVRFVLHKDVDDEGVERAIAAFTELEDAA